MLSLYLHNILLYMYNIHMYVVCIVLAVERSLHWCWLTSCLYTNNKAELKWIRDGLGLKKKLESVSLTTVHSPQARQPQALIDAKASEFRGE